MSNSADMQVPQGLREVFSERRDTEENIIQLDIQYELSNGIIREAIEYIKSKFGKNVRLVPISGQSAGGGVFNLIRQDEHQTIVGLIIAPPNSLSIENNVEYTISDSSPITQLRTQEVHIDRKNKIAYVGAGVTLSQIEGTVKSALGNNYNVLGTDLTSSSYASAGATFMTGGMGPTRTSFARSVLEMTYYDGQETQFLSDKEKLDAFLETYGWTGIVETIAVPIIQVPPIQFGFALPINNTASEISRLVEHFANKTDIHNRSTGKAFIAGLEIITTSALQLLEKEMPDLEGLSLLMENCKLAKKDSVVFVSGAANSNPFEDMDDPVGIFIDNQTSGLALEQATPFENLMVMKNIREAAPELARRQFSYLSYAYKDHTDINIRINPENIPSSVKAIMKCYEDYIMRIEKLLSNTDELIGEVQVYGHINPIGFDPHYRITLASENEVVVSQAKKMAQEYYSDLVQGLHLACQKTESTFCGGEKGIISNLKILNALKENQGVITFELNNRLKKQQEAICQANQMFSWRAKI